MTLKEMLDEVMLESGFDTETVYATAADDAVKRMVSVANRAARRLFNAHSWQALRKTHQFTMSADVTYPLPSDFKELVPDTGFTDSYFVSVDFRTDPALWRYLQSNTGGTGPRYKFRILSDVIQVFQPTSGDSVTFEYKTDTPINDGDENVKRFANDADTWLLDDDLLVQGITWRYKKLVGMDWQVDAAEYKEELRTAMGQEAGAKTFIGATGDYMSTGPYTETWV